MKVNCWPNRCCSPSHGNGCIYCFIHFVVPYGLHSSTEHYGPRKLKIHQTFEMQKLNVIENTVKSYG